jgi:hypothetical protein
MKLELEKLDCIKEQLNIIVVLHNSELLHLGDFGIHIDFEIGSNT